MVNQRLETVLVAMKNGKIKITAKAKDKKYFYCDVLP